MSYRATSSSDNRGLKPYTAEELRRAPDVSGSFVPVAMPERCGRCDHSRRSHDDGGNGRCLEMYRCSCGGYVSSERWQRDILWSEHMAALRFSIDTLLSYPDFPRATGLGTALAIIADALETNR